MPWTAVLFTVSAAVYLGFQWTIRSLVYPQFALVPPSAFAGYEHRHQQRTTVTVGPLFVVLGVSAVVLFALPPPGISRWWAVAAGGCVAAILLITGLLAVPLHTALSRGWDPALHRRLLHADTLRLGFAVLALALGVTVVALT